MTLRRTAVIGLSAVVLTFPSLVAYADDPEPTDWPQVEQVSGGGSADPQPLDWPVPEQL